MSDQTSTTPHAVLNGAGRVAVDLACVNCEYNLRTLAIEGLCRECGTPVLYTLHARHIQFSPTPWLRTLIHGCLLIIVAPGVSVLMWVILMLFSAPSKPPMEEALAIVPALVLLAVGAWLVTRPDPLIRKFTRRCEPVRRLLAVATIGWTACIAVVICLPDSVRNAATGLVDAAVAIYVIGGPVLLVLLTRHLWNLIRRGASRGILLTYQIAFWLATALSAMAIILLFRDLGFAPMPRAWIELGCMVLLPTSLIATFMLVILTATIIAVARRRALSFQADDRRMFETD